MQKKNREVNVFSLSALDLFCSAMGAFLLVSIILMTQVGHKTPPTKQKTTQPPPLEIKVPEPKPAPAPSLLRLSSLKVMIVIDTTASMGAQLDQLKTDLKYMVITLRELSKDLQMGVAGYKDVVCPVSLQWMDMKPIHTDTPGGDDNYRELQRFVMQLQAYAPNNDGWEESVELGLRKAIEQPWGRGGPMNPDEPEKSIIIVVGDAAAKTQQRQACINMVSQWVQAGKNRKLYSLYVPNVPFRILSRAQDQKQFFKDLAKAGEGSYYTTSGQLMSQILRAVIQ